MDFIRYNFRVILILFVGLSLCGDPQEIASYDPEEFDVNELLNNPLVMEALESNGSRDIITSFNPEEFDVHELLNDPLVIEALEFNETNVEERPSRHEPSEDEINPTLKRKRKPQIFRKLICLGDTFRGNIKISRSFKELEPAKVNPENLSLSMLELKFYKRNGHLWRELEEYHTKEYSGYWAHVCDYFWVKEKAEEPRNRACYIKLVLFFEQAYASIEYKLHQLPSTKAEVLRCVCHYYVQNCRVSASPSVVFAVHKYSDNEYFILTKTRREARYTFTVSDVWTVVLPIPIK